jgi:hypothetical protein
MTLPADVGALVALPVMAAKRWGERFCPLLMNKTKPLDGAVPLARTALRPLAG